MSTRIVERTRQLATSPARCVSGAYPAPWVALLVVSDLALFVVASALGAAIGFHHWESQRIVGHLLVGTAVSLVLWVLVFDRLGLYRRTYALSMKDELYYTVAALLVGTVPQFVLFTLDPGISTSRVGLAFTLLFSVALVGTSRAVLHRVRQKQWLASPRRVAVVGTSENIDRVLQSLDLGESSWAMLIAVDDIEEAVAQIDLSRDPKLQRIDWFNRARTWGCDLLVFTEMIQPNVLAHVMEVAAREHMRLAFAPPKVVRQCYDLTLQTDGHQVLIVPARLRACTPRAQLLKRFMDVFFGCVALLLFAPVMLVAAIAVFLETGRPIFYTQERIGAGGRCFGILKFRSMRQNAENEVGAVWASEKDPRKTRVGTILRRLSIDEMPQLFNVIKGDMSLVGPRPERPVFVDLFRASLPRYDERHLVRPGITGWAQMHMRRVLDTSAATEKLAYDLEYVENWSPYLDVAVLFQTFCEFLFHRAA
ncbi:MAG TPA: sugar transferase [Candidatus Baltobacteraceae bacterium]|jgi:exopolysaccharide biosynthesis polyprenyl glycosylphosphotransferase|nr:sugar transferase [Candidatus Baltobacteraceae bacterium]